MVEILCTGRETITISGAEYPAELVKERMRKINSMHIEYIFGCLEQNASRVRNIKKYLLTTLLCTRDDGQLLRRSGAIRPAKAGGRV